MFHGLLAALLSPADQARSVDSAPWGRGLQSGGPGTAGPADARSGVSAGPVDHRRAATPSPRRHVPAAALGQPPAARPGPGRARAAGPFPSGSVGDWYLPRELKGSYRPAPADNQGPQTPMLNAPPHRYSPARNLGGG